MEQKIVDDIRQFVSSSQEESGNRLTLAAILAVTLAEHFDDVWVWQGKHALAVILVTEDYTDADYNSNLPDGKSAS